MFALTQMFHELQGHVAGHSSFRSRVFEGRSAAHVDRQSSTALIDPKCDTCTKRATRKLLKTNSATISTDNRTAVCSEINAMK
jgi:hypothetical protein